MPGGISCSCRRGACLPSSLGRRSWRCKAANLWQPGSAVGKTMVASSLTGRSQAGAEREEGRGSPVEACGRKPANSFPAREDLDISRHKVLLVYLSFRNASIEIFQNRRRSNEGVGEPRERLMPLRTANSSTSDTPICARKPGKIIIADCAIRRISIAVWFAQLDIDRSWEIYRSVAGLSPC